MRASVFRRLVGVALLCISPGYSYEAMYGLVRDGAVHHESTAAAVTHQAGGDHGHEDGVPISQHTHGSRHQHGTVADHCSHQHASSIPDRPAFAINGRVLRALPNEAPSITSWSSLSEFRPPRA